VERRNRLLEAAQYIVGIEKYDTVIDYSQVADRIAAFLEKK